MVLPFISLLLIMASASSSMMHIFRHQSTTTTSGRMVAPGFVSYCHRPKIPPSSDATGLPSPPSSFFLSRQKGLCCSTLLSSTGQRSYASNLALFKEPRRNPFLASTRLPTVRLSSTLQNDSPKQTKAREEIDPLSKKKLKDSNNTTTTSPRITAWNASSVADNLNRRRIRKGRNKNRFRQHVNPLASMYQVPTQLSSDEWPRDVFEDCSKPLHLDVGSGKGGFLLDLAKYECSESSHQMQHEHSSNKNIKEEDDVSSHPILPSSMYKYNYLGLEIRPLVAQFAKDRIVRHNLTGVLEFVGCNANVDLDRLLRLYHGAAVSSSCANMETIVESNKDVLQSKNDTHSSNDVNLSIQNQMEGRNQSQPSVQVGSPLLERVTVQFPDPHFKTQHAKRRVVTDEFVDVLARYMVPETGIVFLQSDIQTVLDSMREVFSSSPFFQDSLPSQEDYLSENILGVPTEREISTLNRTLPVYRCLFHRTETRHPNSPFSR